MIEHECLGTALLLSVVIYLLPLNSAVLLYSLVASLLLAILWYLSIIYLGMSDNLRSFGVAVVLSIASLFVETVPMCVNNGSIYETSGNA